MVKVRILTTCSDQLLDSPSWPIVDDRPMDNRNLLVTLIFFGFVFMQSRSDVRMTKKAMNIYI